VPAYVCFRDQTMNKQKSIFLLRDSSFEAIYNEQAITRIQAMTDNDGQVHTPESILENPDAYKDVSIVFSGWGAPVLDEALLSKLPSLKAFFYGAGSVRSFVTDAFWERNILLTSSYLANAIPVAQFTAATVVLSLKKFWYFQSTISAGIGYDDKRAGVPGAYAGSRVGIISLGAIGRLVCERLAEMELDVYAYDPFASDDVYKACGAKRVDSLDALFRDCEVVSLHAPWLKETENMITGDLLRSMPDGATFINTSRGKIVDEAQMIEVLTARPEIYAVIDVTQSDVDYEKSPLAGLPNVALTPHIAGSMGRECHRMGAYAVEECSRFLTGKPPITGLDAVKVERMA